MDRRGFIKAAGLAAGATVAGSSLVLKAATKSVMSNNTSVRKPNLLFIFTDEHPAKGWSRGIAELKTPNMDRLAREGTVVTNCVSNNPICVPRTVQIFVHT